MTLIKMKIGFYKVVKGDGNYVVFKGRKRVGTFLLLQQAEDYARLRARGDLNEEC